MPDGKNKAALSSFASKMVILPGVSSVYKKARECNRDLTVATSTEFMKYIKVMNKKSRAYKHSLHTTTMSRRIDSPKHRQPMQ